MEEKDKRHEFGNSLTVREQRDPINSVLTRGYETERGFRHISNLSNNSLRNGQIKKCISFDERIYRNDGVILPLQKKIEIIKQPWYSNYWFCCR